MQILTRENTTVIAGARNPDTANALQHLKKSSQDRLHVIALDLSNTASIHVSCHPGLSTLDIVVVKFKYKVSDVVCTTTEPGCLTHAMFDRLQLKVSQNFLASQELII